MNLSIIFNSERCQTISCTCSDCDRHNISPDITNVILPHVMPTHICTFADNIGVSKTTMPAKRTFVVTTYYLCNHQLYFLYRTCIDK